MALVVLNLAVKVFGVTRTDQISTVSTCISSTKLSCHPSSHTQEPVSRLVSAYNHCKDQHQMDPICAWERPKKKNTGAFDDLSTITNSLSAYNHCKDQHQMDPICAWERPKQNNRAICQSKRENSFIHKTIRESIDY